MYTLWKLIHSPAPCHLIPILAQILEIPCKRCTITAYIHNSLRSHLHHSLKQRLITPFSRWVYNNDICICLFTMFTLILRVVIRQDFLRLANKELCIFNGIYLRIVLCIFNRLRYNLNTIDLLCLLSKEKGNSSDSQ